MNDAHVSRKLVVRADGSLFLVVDAPKDGYTVLALTAAEVSHHDRSWQAMAAASGDAT